MQGHNQQRGADVTICDSGEAETNSGPRGIA